MLIQNTPSGNTVSERSVFIMEKKIPFFPSEPPEDVQDTAFDITSVASANEYTGIGHISPILPDDAEDLTDMYTKDDPESTR